MGHRVAKPFTPLAEAATHNFRQPVFQLLDPRLRAVDPRLRVVVIQTLNGALLPLFCALMIIGLIWCVVYYLSPSGSWPIPNIGAWNLGIGFALNMIGFLMPMGWR